MTSRRVLAAVVVWVVATAGMSVAESVDHLEAASNTSSVSFVVHAESPSTPFPHYWYLVTRLLFAELRARCNHCTCVAHHMAGRSVLAVVMQHLRCDKTGSSS